MQNAASVAAMVLTTESMITEIPEPTPAALLCLQWTTSLDLALRYGEFSYSRPAIAGRLFLEIAKYSDTKKIVLYDLHQD
ncbi:MAG: hypothetical protein CM1200mP15_06500 [Dehalococcoidia bacterium]|nr:MAG: hypothetical protein CM1200mP15_06500 [Dehalococcoidia bacterium]